VQKLTGAQVLLEHKADANKFVINHCKRYTK